MLTTALLAQLALLVQGCDHAGPTYFGMADVASVTIAPDVKEVDVGETIEVTAVAATTAGSVVQFPSFSWGSSDPAIASVEPGGPRALVTPHAQGTVMIWALTPETGDTLVLTVKPPVVTPPPAEPPPAEPPPAEPPPTEPPPAEPPPAEPPPSEAYTPLIYDDFTRYASTTALLANIGEGKLYSFAHSPELAQLDREVTYRGHPTVRYVEPGGTDREFQPTVELPTKVGTLWLRMKIRFMPGWTTAGVTADAAQAYKIAGGGWSGKDGRFSLELTDTDRYTLTMYVKDPSSGTMMLYNEVNAGHVAGEWSDGAWYDFILYYEQTSATTARTRFWLARDGETPVIRAEAKGEVVGSLAPLVDRVMIGMNFNQQRSAGQNQYHNIGYWEVVDGTKYRNPYKIPGF
jgi:hypothetical protein